MNSSTAYLAVVYHSDGRTSEFVDQYQANVVSEACNAAEEYEEVRLYDILYDSLGEPEIQDLIAVINAPMKDQE